MKKYKVLNIKGSILDKNQLENYLEKIASDHIISKNSDKYTYPIYRLEKNLEVITKVYNLLNEHLKLGINIHPAGEWLLDNYYIIEQTTKEIKQDLSLKKYTNFLGISNGQYKGFARIYVLASQIVAYTGSKITKETLEDFLKSYQSKKTLTMEEIWSIGVFMQIAIIENIREISEKIYQSQIQKYKVESIVERYVDKKEKIKFKERMETNRWVDYEEVKYSFVEYMSYKLKKYGKEGIKYEKVLEQEVLKTGNTVADIIKKEHFAIAIQKVEMGNLIKSIKEISRINFLEIFEHVNGVEEILKKDPANIYEKMDYKTKAYYRNKIKEISKKTKISEIYIAEKVLEFSLNKKEKLERENVNLEKNLKEAKKIHIGYYLIDEGINTLLR